MEKDQILYLTSCRPRLKEGFFIPQCRQNDHHFSQWFVAVGECDFNQKMCDEAWAQCFSVNPFENTAFSCLFYSPSSLFSLFPLTWIYSSMFSFLQQTQNFYVLNFFLILTFFLFTGGITREMVNVLPSPNFNAKITIWLIREWEKSHFLWWWRLQTRAHSSASVHSQRGPWVRNVIFEKKRHLSSHVQQAQNLFLTARQGRNTAWQTPPQAHDDALMMGFLENKMFIIYFAIYTGIAVRVTKMSSWESWS